MNAFMMPLVAGQTVTPEMQRIAQMFPGLGMPQNQQSPIPGGNPYASQPQGPQFQAPQMRAPQSMDANRIGMRQHNQAIEENPYAQPKVPGVGQYDPNEKGKNALGMSMSRGTANYLSDLGAGIGQAFDNPFVQALSYANQAREQRVNGDPKARQQEFENTLALRQDNREEAAATKTKWRTGEVYDENGNKQPVLYDENDPMNYKPWGKPKKEGFNGTPVKILDSKTGQPVYATPADAIGEQPYIEPKEGRQPTEMGRKYAYYKSRGLPDDQAYGLAVGAIQPVTDPVTGSTYMFDRAAGQPAGGAPQAGAVPPPADGSPAVPWASTAPKDAVVKRAGENDSLDQAITRIDNMLAGETFQEGVGPKSSLGRAYNRAVRPIVGGEGFPESDQVKLEADTLMQMVVGLYQSGDKRVTEGDFTRLERVMPTGSFTEDTKAARQKLAEARKIFEEIRNRPLASDPRQAGQNNTADPLGMSGQSGASSNDPLGLFK